ncbi:hypothetical protein OPV22_029622 [Ensete ventricosum]|uniref:Transmembrane protein n=1 Tax=Ensete ventricosum TaxID=4639 RepID=A0AAV8PY06_ENSVE|nr:hypothetical protein OPV22_029622 [Ensete ventricosum]
MRAVEVPRPSSSSAGSLTTTYSGAFSLAVGFSFFPSIAFGWSMVARWSCLFFVLCSASPADLMSSFVLKRRMSFSPSFPCCPFFIRSSGLNSVLERRRCPLLVLVRLGRGLGKGFPAPTQTDTAAAISFPRHMKCFVLLSVQRRRQGTCDCIYILRSTVVRQRGSSLPSTSISGQRGVDRVQCQTRSLSFPVAAAVVLILESFPCPRVTHRIGWTEKTNIILYAIIRSEIKTEVRFTALALLDTEKILKGLTKQKPGAY